MSTKRKRTKLAKEIKNAQKEFDKNKCKPATPNELMREIRKRSATSY